jgi:hypothetical protein
MSPIARSQGHAGRALLIAAGGLVLTLAVAWGLSVLDSKGKVDVKLGDDTFADLNAERTAKTIAEDGPFVLADASAGGDRDIVLQHLGDDDETGWLAIAARPDGAPRNCTIQWQADDQVFRLLDDDRKPSDECDGREFPADGGDLEKFPVKVVDGRLDVDLNAADRASSTTR